jgi:sugar phosphate isomerase/epimerase
MGLFLGVGKAASTGQWAVGTTPGPLRLGIDCYTLRDLDWKADQSLDYAASVGADAIQVNLGDLESTEDTYLRKVREHARRIGVTIEPGINAISPLSGRWNPRRQGTPTEHLLLGLRLAKALGAPCVKCYMGYAGDRRSETPIPAMMEAAIEALKTVRSQAVDAGVKFAVENHGDLLAREVKTIIEEAGPDFVGCCLDTGNPVVLAEDPLLALEVLGPYTVTTHIRDSAVYQHPRGAAFQWVALGDGSIDFKAFVARFRQLCPQAPLLMEILTGFAPRVLPYFEPEYWSAFPDMPAADFARFVALARRGRPFDGKMVMDDADKQSPELQDTLKQQQRVDLERSLEYAKKTLDVGVNWRKGDSASD